MADERSVFERLDSIEATGEDTNKMIAKVLDILQNQKQIESPQAKPIEQKTSNQEIFQQFLRQSKKSWRWFGTKGEFTKWKIVTIISLLILLIIGLVTSIVSSICFKIYSTFTFFENMWMIFGIIYLVHASKTQLTYEVNALAANSSIKYDTDKLGMKFPRKEKGVFRIFKWLAIISAPCNIICIWCGMGKNNQVLATIFEVLFLITIVFAYFVNMNLFAQYSIIYIEGYNVNTQERVVLVLPPGADQLMPEEEFKKKMPFFYQ